MSTNRLIVAAARFLDEWDKAMSKEMFFTDAPLISELRAAMYEAAEKEQKCGATPHFRHHRTAPKPSPAPLIAAGDRLADAAFATTHRSSNPANWSPIILLHARLNAAIDDWRAGAAEAKKDCDRLQARVADAEQLAAATSYVLDMFRNGEFQDSRQCDGAKNAIALEDLNEALAAWRAGAEESP